MIYDGKELTSQELYALLESKDALLSEKDEKIKELQEVPATEEAPAPAEEAPAPVAEEAPAPAEEAPAEEAPAEEAPAEGKDLSENKKLTEDQKENIRLSEENILLKEDNRKAEVEKQLSDLTSKGIPPVIIEKAKQLMFSDKGGVKTYTLKEEDKDIKKSLSECIIDLISTISGVELSEKTDGTNAGSSEIEGTSTAAERNTLIREYSEKNSCSTADAYHKLLSEGKIEEIKVING